MAKDKSNTLLEARKAISSAFKKTDGTQTSAGELLRESLNKLSGETIAHAVDKDHPLVSIRSWIEMPNFFKKAVGGQGFPQGKFTVLVGEPNTGKTTLLMHAMVRAQKEGGLAILLDSEGKWFADRFESMGGVQKDLSIIPVKTLESAWDALVNTCAAVEALRAGGFDAPVIIGWDSIGQTASGRLADADSVENSAMMVSGAVNARGIVRAIPAIRMAQVAVVAVNQEYVGAPAFPGAPPSRVIKGGKAIQYSAPLILRTAKGKRLSMKVDGADADLGVSSKIQVIKGQLGGIQEQIPFYVVANGILESEEELAEYKKQLRAIPTQTDTSTAGKKRKGKQESAVRDEEDEELTNEEISPVGVQDFSYDEE